MRQNIIITGLSGFIGGHLYDALKAKGASVIGLVQDTDENRRKSWGCEARFFDLARPDSMKGLCKDGGIVYHLASIPREQRNFTEEDYRKVNVDGTRVLLEESLKAGVERFVYISTIEAVGPAENGVPLTEETPPHPVNAYGRSKLAAEEIVRQFHGNKMATVIVRLPMIYGPGNYLNVPKLFRAVQRPVFPIIGNGKALMEFCYVGNAVHGILLAGEHEKAKGETFFISDGSRPLTDVIRAVAAAEEARPAFLHIPVPLAFCIAFVFEALAAVFPFAPFQSSITRKPYFSRKTVEWTSQTKHICSSKKAIRLLGYQPPYNLKDGIIVTVKDFKDRGWIK